MSRALQDPKKPIKQSQGQQGVHKGQNTYGFINSSTRLLANLRTKLLRIATAWDLLTGLVGVNYPKKSAVSNAIPRAIYSSGSEGARHTLHLVRRTLDIPARAVEVVTASAGGGQAEVEGHTRLRHCGGCVVM